MAQLITELAGALVTAAAPVAFPWLGQKAGEVFKNEHVSRIAAGTMWNFAMNRRRSSPANESIEMDVVPRSRCCDHVHGTGGISRGRVTKSKSVDSAAVIRRRRTAENQEVRFKKRLANGLPLLYGIGGLTCMVLALLALAPIGLTVPLWVLGLGIGLLVNAICTTSLASHYKMHTLTKVPALTQDNAEDIDWDAPINRPNDENSFWFLVTSLVAPLSCLFLSLGKAGDDREKVAQIMLND